MTFFRFTRLDSFSPYFSHANLGSSTNRLMFFDRAFVLL
jgi:hypothetical protein